MTDPTVQTWDIGTGVAGYAWQAQKPRAALLLQHGYAEYAERFVHSYSQLIPHLQAIGISVFAFDMRGHGASPGAPGVTDLVEAVRDHVAARQLLASARLPLFLLGHSMGGLVTAASVIEDPGGVTGVMLSSPGFAKSKFATRLLVNGIAMLKPTFGVVTSASPFGLSRDQVQVQRFVEDSRIYRGRISALLASTGLKVAKQVRDRSARWYTPTLVVHGTEDRFTDLALSKEFFRTIASSDKTLKVFNGGFHELLNDICADEVLRVLTDWIEQRLDKTGEEFLT